MYTLLWASLMARQSRICLPGDVGSTLGSRRSTGEGNGKLLQYSCLGNPMDREAWWATVYRREESDMT